AAEFGRSAEAAELLERDWSREPALRAPVSRDAATPGDRIAQLTTTAAAVRETAQRCREKIADPPRLGVPDVEALGPVPPVPDGADVPGSWTAARAALDAYQARLQQAAAALAEAGRRFAAPLAERAELRGLAQAYRAKAAAAGLIEDPVLDAQFTAARAELWRGPRAIAGPRAPAPATAPARPAAGGAA